jgi:Golgi apparatus protein 1
MPLSFPSAGAPSVADACREAVYQFKISRNANINHNVPLAKACKDDAEMYCNVTWFFGYR